MAEVLLRLEDVSRRTGLSVRALRTLRWEQDHGQSSLPRLPFRKLGARLVVLESELDAWIATAAQLIEEPAA
jgi:predicted DNA-binding transcriptional regulator AlpA